MDWAGLVTTLILVVEYAIKIVAVGTVPENRSPGSSNAWLLLILLLPLVGLPLYLLLGSPYVQGRRRRVQELANRNIAELTASVSDMPGGVEAPPGLPSIVAMNRRLTSMPCLSGENLGLLTDAKSTIAALTQAVDSARDTIHVEFYIAAWDDTTTPFFEALTAAVSRGVKVRFLFDHLGTRGYPGYRTFKRRMTAAGIEWHAMMPLDPLRGSLRRPDLRNHRKLMVVDNEIGFMGSMNLIDPSYLRPQNVRRGLRWLDLNLMLRGPIVQQLSHVFTLDWLQETHELIHPEDGRATVPASQDAERVQKALPRWPAPRTDPEPGEISMQLIPSGPGFLTEPNLRLFVALIHRAQHSLEIVSPYFVPDESLLMAITSAAQRGVRVELFASEQSDQFMVFHAQRSYYEALLRAGVRIWLYAKPTILHTKFLTVDGQVAVIGSSNMDMRSFHLDFEISLLGMDPEFAAAHSRVAEDYRRNSIELTLDEWQGRPWPMRYLDNLMRLTASLQ
jgi:cardiolipin synthase A/B